MKMEQIILWSDAVSLPGCYLSDEFIFQTSQPGVCMRKTVLVHGLISGGIIIAVICGTIAVWGGLHELEGAGQWIGYLVMVVALSAIFFGVKSYRDNTLGGVIKFKTAFLVGLLIALVATAVYVVGWEAYLAVSKIDFMEQYTATQIEHLKAKGVSGEELEKQVADLNYWKEMYKNPLIRMAITSMEILPVGLIIALLCAAILRKSEVLPVRT
jgi:hypothetical protein